MKREHSAAQARSILRGAFLLGLALALAAAGSMAAGQTRPDSERAAAARRDGRRPLAARQHRPARGERRGFRPGRRDAGAAARLFGRRAAGRLELTEAQRDRLREAYRQVSDERRESRRQIADARRSFREASRNSESTAEELAALGVALGRARAEAVVQRRAARERIAGILTEEQRERLEAWREERQERQRRAPRARRRAMSR